MYMQIEKQKEVCKGNVLEEKEEIEYEEQTKAEEPSTRNKGAGKEGQSVCRRSFQEHYTEIEGCGQCQGG